MPMSMFQIMAFPRLDDMVMLMVMPKRGKRAMKGKRCKGQDPAKAKGEESRLPSPPSGEVVPFVLYEEGSDR